MANKNTHKTTADLMVSHTHAHLAVRGLSEFIAPALFTTGGIVVILVAFTLMQMSLTETTPVFFADNAGNYAAQQAFYTGSELHAAASVDSAAAREAVHAAARDQELSRVFVWLAVWFAAALLWYLEKTYQVFQLVRPSFTIKKIK